MKLYTDNPSVTAAPCHFSLRFGHGAALICHRHIIHFRAATSLPFTQGKLWGGAGPKAAANLTGKVLLYYNSIALPLPYVVAGVGRAAQDVVGQEKSEKSPENRAKKACKWERCMVH